MVWRLRQRPMLLIVMVFVAAGLVTRMLSQQPASVDRPDEVVGEPRTESPVPQQTTSTSTSTSTVHVEGVADHEPEDPVPLWRAIRQWDEGSLGEIDASTGSDIAPEAVDELRRLGKAFWAATMTGHGRDRWPDWFTPGEETATGREWMPACCPEGEIAAVGVAGWPVPWIARVYIVYRPAPAEPLEDQVMFFVEGRGGWEPADPGQVPGWNAAGLVP